MVFYQGIHFLSQGLWAMRGTEVRAMWVTWNTFSYLHQSHTAQWLKQLGINMAMWKNSQHSSKRIPLILEYIVIYFREKHNQMAWNMSAGEIGVQTGVGRNLVFAEK
jgi:hypothetical protein